MSSCQQCWYLVNVEISTKIRPLSWGRKGCGRSRHPRRAKQEGGTAGDAGISLQRRLQFHNRFRGFRTRLTYPFRDQDQLAQRLEAGLVGGDEHRGGLGLVLIEQHQRGGLVALEFDHALGSL